MLPIRLVGWPQLLFFLFILKRKHSALRRFLATRSRSCGRAVSSTQSERLRECEIWFQLRKVCSRSNVKSVLSCAFLCVNRHGGEHGMFLLGGRVCPAGEHG